MTGDSHGPIIRRRRLIASLPTQLVAQTVTGRGRVEGPGVRLRSDVHQSQLSEGFEVLAIDMGGISRPGVMLDALLHPAHAQVQQGPPRALSIW